MPLDVIILGPPGAGKGTQARQIAEDAEIPHIATGDIIRAIREQDTELGREVKAVYDRGDLVSDELMIEIIRDRLSQPDTEPGFVLDGFPRTLPQAESLDSLLEELDRDLTVVLNFQVPEDVSVDRLFGRSVAEVSGVLVTHAHHDHYGLACRVRAETGAWVATSLQRP